MAKYKILGLHGYVQSGPILSRKAGALRKELEKLDIELVCPTGPHKTLAADVSDPDERAKLHEAEINAGGWDYYCWYEADEDKKEMRGMDVSVAAIRKVMEEQVFTPPAPPAPARPSLSICACIRSS